MAHTQPGIQELIDRFQRFYEFETDNPDLDFTVFENIDADLADAFYDVINTQFERLKPRLSYDSLRSEITVQKPITEHGAALEWMIYTWGKWADNVGSGAIKRDIRLDLAATNKGFTGRYSRSQKDPVFQFKVKNGGLQFPSVVLEMGIAKSDTRLRWDKDLWLDGTQGQCKAVILVSLKKRSDDTFEGFVEVWGRNSGHIHAQFLPELENETDPVILLSELYGGAANVPESKNPNQMLFLSLKHLRYLLMSRWDPTTEYPYGTEDDDSSASGDFETDEDTDDDD